MEATKIIKQSEMRTLITIHKDIFACLFSIHNTITLSCHEQVCLRRLFTFRKILLPSLGNVNDCCAYLTEMCGLLWKQQNLQIRSCAM